MQTQHITIRNNEKLHRVLLAGVFAGALTLFMLWGFPAYAGSAPGYAMAPDNPEHQGALPRERPPELAIIDSYLDMAAENNPELRRLAHEYRSRREMIPQAGALPDPEIDIAYFINADDPETFAGRFSVSAMQMFPWYGTREARREEQGAMAEEQFYALQSRRSELFTEIQELWFDYTALVQTIGVVRVNRDIVSDLESIVMVRYETARAGTADLLRIQMEDRRLMTRIENLEDSENALKARINERLNREPFSEVEIPGQLPVRRPAHSESALVDLAREKNPKLRQFKAMDAAAQHRTRLARLEGYPAIGVGLEIMGRDYASMAMMPGMDEGYVGMLSISVPLYRGNYDAKVRQSLEDRGSVTRGKEQVSNAIARQMTEYLVDWRESDRNLRLLDNELIPRARQAFKVLVEEYGAGNVSFEEVLQVQRELLDLDIERIGVLAAQNRAVARIEQLYAARPGF